MSAQMHQCKPDFPYFSHHPHLIYLDSAATTHKPASVIARCQKYLEEDYATIHRGQYPAALASEELYRSARQQLATWINAPQDEEIIFCNNSTHASNLAIAGLLRSGMIARGSTIALSAIEHHATLLPRLRAAQEYDLRLHRLPIDEHGDLLPEGWAALTKIQPAAVVISAVSNVTGSIAPVSAIKASLPSETLLLVDASQAAPHIPMDVQARGADMLRCTGHKCYALNGVGLLRARKALLARMEPLLLGGGSVAQVSQTGYTLLDAPDKFEAGTPNVLAVGSRGKALDYIDEQGGIAALRTQEIALMDYTLDRFSTLENRGLLRLLGQKKSDTRVGVFSFVSEKMQSLAQQAAQQNIALRAGFHCAQPLHTALGCTASARISFGLYTDVNDIHIFFSFLEQSLAKA